MLALSVRTPGAAGARRLSGFVRLNALQTPMSSKSVGRSGRRWPRLSAGPLPLHLLPDGARIDPSGRLSIAGVDLLDLCRDIGTPVFVYDEEHIRRRCRQAVGAWGGGVAYASKAFLCRAMARLVHEEGMAIDVSTGGELHVALAAGVPGSRLVLHGNNKSDAELARALEVRVGRIVVDSFDEIDRLERLAVAGRLAPRSADPGHSGDRGPHPRVRHDRSGRFQVRLRIGVGRGGRRRRPGSSRRWFSGCSGGRPRPYRLADLRPRFLREGAGCVGGVLFAAEARRVVHRRRSGRTVRDRRVGAVDLRVGGDRTPGRQSQRSGARGASDRRTRPRRSWPVRR